MTGIPTPSRWAGRRVLVTGHTGFKGAWLVHWLTRAGADVMGLSLPEPVSEPALFDLAAVASELRASWAGDVRDAEELGAVVREAAPEVVFHLAAQPLVRASYRMPVETWMTNVMGTAHLLEAVRATASVRAVVVCTTDKCYENMTVGHRPFRENDPLGGYDPYSSSKAGTELVVAAWRRSFFGAPGAPGVASVRAGNVVGGGDFAQDRLIPDLVRHWRAGTATPIRHPDATRPWQHVLEPLGGYITVAERLLVDGTTVAEAWNFGPDLRDVKPVSWVASRCVDGLPGARWDTDVSPRPHEAATLALDWSKARSRLGWTPRWDLSTTLARTVGWYRAWAEATQAGVRGEALGRTTRALMDADIDAYEAQPLPRGSGGFPAGSAT